MPFEYTRRIPREQYGFEEFKIVWENTEGMADDLLALDTLIAERIQSAPPMMEPDDIPFDDPGHPLPTDDDYEQFQNLKRSRMVEVKCGVCGGETWDNTENKKNPRAPDYKCKDKQCGGAMWLTNEGEHGQWKH